MPAHPKPRPCFECVCGDHSWAAATRGFIVMVSVPDDYLLHARAWTAVRRSRSIYAQARIKGTAVYLHQLIEQSIGAGEIDHRNRWGLDNRRSNLRDASRSQNACNTRPRRTKNRTSVFKGVSWAVKDRTWVAYISLSGRTTYIGAFETEIKAAQAYDAEASKHHGEFAYLNLVGVGA